MTHDKIILLHRDGTTETVNVSQVNNIIQDLLFKIDAIESENKSIKEKFEEIAEEYKSSEKEVERLKAKYSMDLGVFGVAMSTCASQALAIEAMAIHTWFDERAAVVKWLYSQGPDVDIAAPCIERGEHWMEGTK